MKKIIPVLITIMAFALIVFGATYFMEDNKNFSSKEEKTTSTEKDNTNEENNTNEKEKNTYEFKEPEYDKNKEKVKLYLFWGNGCPHCEEAKEWFDEIEPSYGKYFEIISYEVWYDEENANLMTKVGEYLGEEARGVPFIVIGEETYQGFADVYKEKIMETIFNEYEKDERIDVISKVNEKEG